MDFANRGNRPMQQQSAPQVGGGSEPSFNMSQQPAAQEKPKKEKTKLDFSKLSSVFVLFGVAILIAVLIVGLVFGGKTETTENQEAALIKTDKYQAVFLDSQDGQVYFGKMKIFNSDLYVLEDIYYVRVDNPVQPEGQNRQQQANISLAKLGNELHGPEDAMFINKDRVLFWENLKDDGQVVKAISEFKKNGGNTNQDASTQQQNQNNGGNATGTEQTTQQP